MRRSRLAWSLCLLALLVAPAFGGKKVGYMRKPGSDAVAGFSVIPAIDKCASWGWAAATESILALDKVAVDQHVLVQRAFGGELCVDDGLDLRALGDIVAGDYVIGPRKKMRVVTRVFPAGAIGAEDIIAAVRRGRPIILFWKMRPYVVSAAAYDEYIGPRGTRLFEIRELTLLDPSDPGTPVSFVKQDNDLRELNGAMEFVLFPMEEVEWVPQ